MNHSTNTTDTCSARTWCNYSHHGDDEHTGFRWETAATADRENFQPDLVNGGVKVPSVGLWLTENDAVSPTFPGPCIGIGISGPRSDVDTALTLFEAEMLRDRLTQLLEEVVR